MSEFVNGVCIDWFEFTTHIDSTESVIKLLGLEDNDFLPSYGIDGYKQCLAFNHILVLFDGQDGMGIHVSMSGQGCRNFERYSTSNWQKLISYISDNPNDVKMTRLDVAYDDFNYLIDLPKLIDEVKAGNCVTRFRFCEVIDSINFKTLEDSYSLNFGRKSSNTFLRIYDKLKERESKNIIAEGCTHWVRAEFMLRKNNANRFVQLLDEGKDIEELYFLVLNNYIRFVKPNSTDSNKWRWELADYWADFCNSVISDKISLYVAPTETYDEYKLRDYVERQAGAAVYTYIQKYSIKDLMDNVDNKKFKLALKYRELLIDELVDNVSGDAK